MMFLTSLVFAAPTTGCVTEAAALPPSAYHSADDKRFAANDVIVVLKGARRVMVFDHGTLAKTKDESPACWAVGLGAGYPAGHKQQQGDMKTPEGWYRTSDRPWSQFYSAITVHYPEKADAERGLKAGLINASQARAIHSAQDRGVLPPMTTKLGGQILLHGGGSGSDWTLGCVALEDADIDALRSLLPANMQTRVLILP